MSNQVEQIRAEVERRIKSWAAGVKYEGDAGDCQSRVTELTDLKKFIDSLPKEDGPKKPYFDKEYIESKIKAFSEAHKGETAEQIEAVCRGEEAPIEVCGKKVVVRYARTPDAACASCAFCDRKECHDLDCNMRDIIGESVSKYAYFAEAEHPEEKDYKRLYEELVNSDWYKKYYQGASAGDSVAVEQPEEEAPARPANPLVPDQGLTIDGKRYVKRYFRIGDACSRCAFKVGEDAKGHARCKDHGKPEKPCTPDREKGVLVYFIAADQLQEEIHSLQEWAKIMAEHPELRAEFGKMCPLQPIQGSIAPEADFEVEYKQYMASRRDDVSGHAVTINLKDLALHFAEWERARIESELRLAWGKISMNPFDTDSVFRELLEHLKR